MNKKLFITYLKGISPTQNFNFICWISIVSNINIYFKNAKLLNPALTMV